MTDSEASASEPDYTLTIVEENGGFVVYEGGIERTAGLSFTKEKIGPPSKQVGPSLTITQAVWWVLTQDEDFLPQFELMADLDRSYVHCHLEPPRGGFRYAAEDPKDLARSEKAAGMQITADDSLVRSNSLADLAARAKSEHAAVANALQTSLSHALAAGDILMPRVQDRPTRRDDIIAFYGEAGSVRPLAFAAAIKDMKALLHNA